MPALLDESGRPKSSPLLLPPLAVNHTLLAEWRRQAVGSLLVHTRSAWERGKKRALAPKERVRLLSKTADDKSPPELGCAAFFEECAVHKVHRQGESCSYPQIPAQHHSLLSSHSQRYLFLRS